MGTSALSSPQVTNADATPRVANNARVAGAHIRRSHGFVTAAAADDTASRYKMCRVPTNCFVSAVLLSSIAQGGSGALNIGVYRTAADGGAAVSATLFASAVSVVSAVTKSDVTNQSTSYTAAKQEQPLWQAAGLSADPGGEFDIMAAPSAALTNGGAIALDVEYTV